VLGEHVSDWGQLITRSADEHRRRGIDVREQTEVVGIDLAAQRVHWRAGSSGAEGVEPYDLLAYTTGAHDVRPDLPGLDLGYPVFTPRQAMQLGGRLPPVQRALVVGGGYIGLEMVEAMRARGIATTLITRSAHCLRRTFDPEMATQVESVIESMQVDFRPATPLQAIERSSDAVVAHTARGEIETDIVILAIGSAPTVELAQAAGISLGETGAVAVDHEQRTRIDGVFAAGDCAEAWDVVGRRWSNWHLGTIANKAGRVAGRNVAALSRGDPLERFPGASGTTIVRLGEFELARTGLLESDARAQGFQIDTQQVETRQIAGYMPGASPLHAKLIFARDSGRVLGGQIVGQRGAGKRIDVVATAVMYGLTLQQLVDADLAYAPPFSPVWDPVQTAARAALQDQSRGSGTA